MITITDNYFEESAAFKMMGVELPKKQASTHTVNWLHFGGGNLFRAFHMEVQQDLINKGISTSKIALVETFDKELIENIYHINNNRALKVELTNGGKNRITLLDSIEESIYLNNESDFDSVKKYFISEKLQLITFTITEKGYNLKDSNGNYYSFIEEELKNGPTYATTTIGWLIRLLNERFLAGAFPLALVSTDNFSHNGDKLKNSVLTIAKEWQMKGFLSQAFLTYLENDKKISFPWSMIDRITPNPSSIVQAQLQDLGFSGMDIIKTNKGSISAAFSNTEETHYLVIEDDFPNGRPDLAQAGVILTDRETVDKIERMKVCTCLNPLHTSLAIFGSLLRYEYIYDEMRDEDLRQLVQQIGYIEGLPVVVNPVVINPESFLAEVLTKRLPNPYIPDTPQRIATDTSQKLAIRFGNTISEYINNPQLKDEDLVFIPLTIAGWLRYLLGIDDEGEEFPLSSDPLLQEIKSELAMYTFGHRADDLTHLDNLLKNEIIFGVNLVEVGLSDIIKDYFNNMLSGKGAVRQVLHTTLEKYSYRLENISGLK